MVTSHERQPAEERLVTEKFIKVAQLPIHSMESRSPPEPDIYCVHQCHGPMYFEFIRISDENIEKIYRNREISYNKIYPIITSYPTSFRKKLTRTYSCKHPIELICYHTGVGTIGANQDVVANLKYVLDGYPEKIPFRKIWYFGIEVSCLLYSSHKEN
jgi:hypothetical protein